MLGERTGKRFRLGDRVRIKVAQVEIESSKIDFVMAEAAAPSARPAAAKTGKAGKPEAAKIPAPAKKAAKKPAAKKTKS
jgi:ribonuclease R